jgi:hypothetical protein
VAPDPIAAAPHAVWYVRPASGGQFGPAAGDIMRQWINEGRVAADSLVWQEGWPDWQTAGAVFPQLANNPSAFPAQGSSPGPVVTASPYSQGTTTTRAGEPWHAELPQIQATPASRPSAVATMPRKSSTFPPWLVVSMAVIAVALVVTLVVVLWPPE